MNAKSIIEQAKKMYPVSFHYKCKSQLTVEQYSEITKQCEIHCSSEYMDGSRMYCIRYKAGEKV